MQGGLSVTVSREYRVPELPLSRMSHSQFQNAPVAGPGRAQAVCRDCFEVREPPENLWSWVRTQQVFAERPWGWTTELGSSFLPSWGRGWLEDPQQWSSQHCPQ